MAQRVAVVTGGTRGIGGAISRMLKEKGYKVAATYAGNEDAAQKFKAETGIAVYKFDVSDFAACQAVITQIEKDLGPVNIGSINGQGGQYGQVNYAAAKSGIHGFTKALAQEGASKGITVNAIAPGYTETDMVAAVPANVLEKIVAKIPVGRLGKAEEIGRGVMFLIADDAGFITGSTLSINGGQHMY